jgi:chitin disaccharide deacetylase
MLIVNADDLGRSKAATDTAFSCYKRKRISSASAMVFMEDSERAADCALASGLDVGLHINLSERLTGASVPGCVRDSHARLCRFLRSNKYALLFYNPCLRKQFREVIQAQYGEFFRLYYRAPSHLNGHQHMHLATNILIDEIIPQGTKVRRSFSFQSGEKSIVNRLYRASVDRLLSRHHRMTNYFFALSQHLTLTRLEQVISLSKNWNVELMAHPQIRQEYELLMSDDCGVALSRTRLAGFREL